MAYAIIGFRSIGQALARAFARQGLPVSVATTRDPSSFESEAHLIGPTVKAKTLKEAIHDAEVIFLAVRFESYANVASALPSWKGKTIVDVTNAYGVSPSKLDGKPSSTVVQNAFKGAKLVKGFNHLPASVLNQGSTVLGTGKRVIFLAGDDEEAVKKISTLTQTLGFAPVYLGELALGGQLIGSNGNAWGHLIFKDLVKFDKGV